jgi:hypothetical protein
MNRKWINLFDKFFYFITYIIMKKTVLLSLILLSCILLTACTNKSKENSLENETSDNGILSSNIENMSDCQKVIQDYLA